MDFKNRVLRRVFRPERERESERARERERTQRYA
jgi:hypothetical protein